MVSGHSLVDRRVLVVGLGRFGGGVGVTRWLLGQGARVTVTDQADAESLQASIDAVGDASVTYRLGAHDPRDLDAADLVVVNPAVQKNKSDFFREIAARKVQWTTELNLFCERCPATVIGVTGTYGKSTTCAMIAHILRNAHHDAGDGKRVYLGGNIGHSLLEELDEMRPDDLVVLEMSNAQLEDIPRIGFAPAVSVITNLSPHHLDRYNSYAEYVHAKRNIIGPPRQTRAIVLGALDAASERILREQVADLDSRTTRVTPLNPPASLVVPGEHNQVNAACAATVARVCGVPGATIREALANFRGLPHRIEFVAAVGEVDFFNDSKSTSPSATIVALKALARPVVAIVGGQLKDVPLDPCAGALAASCRAVVCTGQSGPSFARAVSELKGATGCIVREAATLAEAVRAARDLSRKGDAVLFSPGAPSFDQYPNFEYRGRHFVELVRELTG